MFKFHTPNHPKYTDFSDYPLYLKEDLGLTYSKEYSILKVYSPAIDKLSIFIYLDSEKELEEERYDMILKEYGVWEIQLEGDYLGKYYNFQASKGDHLFDRVPDPYAKAVGVNGHRAMFLDLKAIAAKNPIVNAPKLHSINDSILYEAHIRDLTIHPSSGNTYKGQFLGLSLPNTKSPNGLNTGLSHLTELGITHIHLLPIFDYSYNSVDERFPNQKYNWGYDPQNYNALEGSYSTKPQDASVRIKEFRTMIDALHKEGIRVIMDVVYNHTGATALSNFNQIAPGYYYRFNPDGSFSNASGCGNELASERPMVRKFIIDSVIFWTKYYQIDGFRIDLMGIHDIKTIQTLSKALKEINPNILIYGEGWTAGDSPLPYEKRALKVHAPQFEEVAVFSDDIRDGLKGSVFHVPDKGFINGNPLSKTSIMFGIVGATNHPQIDYTKVNYSDIPYARHPQNCINYASCHDNHTLFDRLLLNAEANKEQIDTDTIARMHRLANAIVLTSQGIPFIHAGSEFLRSKKGVENSYKSPDEINQINWEDKEKYLVHFNYYKQLIALRKEHPAFRMPTTAMIQKHLEFIDLNDDLAISYLLKHHANQDTWKNILVVFNANTTPLSIDLPNGEWRTIAWEDSIMLDGISTVTNTCNIPSISTAIFYQN